MTLLEVRDVWKKFRLQHERAGTLKEAVIRWAAGRGEAEEFWALRAISFQVQAGEALGIIGRNGSGKSTLFKLVGGILRPDRGRITVRGRISPMIELGAGFHPDLTGLENIALNGAILGLGRQEIARRTPDIVEFSELGGFIDTPIKHYSSGMLMRLAFAIAIHVEGELLLVDEVLAVGDLAFQHKCRRKMEELRGAGMTIIYVSHDLASVEELCPRALWLDGGELVMQGPSREVTRLYRKAVLA